MHTRSKPEMMRELCAILMIAALYSLFSENLSAADLERGKLIYETDCNECHSKSVSERPNRKAKSISEIRRWVVQWESYKHYQWTNEDVDDVTQYLNSRFYKY